MNEERIQNITSPRPEEQEIDLIELAQKVWASRKLVFKASGIAALVGLVVAFSIPKEYSTSVTSGSYTHLFVERLRSVQQLQRRGLDRVSCSYQMCIRDRNIPVLTIRSTVPEWFTVLRSAPWNDSWLCLLSIRPVSCLLYTSPFSLFPVDVWYDWAVACTLCGDAA